MKTNRLPKRAKKITVTEPEAAEKDLEREDAQVDERVLDAKLPPDEDGERRQPRCRLGERRRSRSSRGLGASMMASTIATSAPATSSVPTTSSERRPGSAVSGTIRSTPASASSDERDVHQEHAAPPEVRQEEAAERRADHDPDAGDGRPCRDRLRALSGREDGVQDRRASPA